MKGPIIVPSVIGSDEKDEIVGGYQNDNGGQIQLLLCTISTSLAANKDFPGCLIVQRHVWPSQLGLTATRGLAGSSPTLWLVARQEAQSFLTF